MTPKVLITHKLLPEAMDFLGSRVDAELCPEKDVLSGADIISRIRDKEGLLSLLTDEIGREIIEAAPRLKVIANCAVGYNNIDLGAARSRGILVTNTPGVLTETTAELTWALILAVSRKIPQAHAFTRRGEFKGWKLNLFLGVDLQGKRLGIIGFGRIGRSVARRAAAFEMDVAYYDPHRLGPEEGGTYRVTYLPLDELLRTSDVVSIHTSLSEETRRLISWEQIGLMKKGAILINVARGPIVDEEALAEALENGRIWGAGLDVYEREPQIGARLLERDNVVLLPHIGSATYETRLKMAMTAARNLVQGLRGERPDNLVV